MKFLAIDTSTRNFVCAISDGGKVLRYRHLTLNKLLSSSIVPTIEKLLKAADTSISELDGFAVGLGPGAFTSLRVGMATVKGLAFAAKKPVVGIASLDILAQGVSGQAKTICPVVDAKRSMVYSCLYQNGKKKGKYCLSSVEHAVRSLKGDVLFVGDGIKLYKDEIKALGKKIGFDPSFAQEDVWYPQAKPLVALAHERFKAKNYDDVDALVPLYLYPEDCQVQRNPTTISV